MDPTLLSSTSTLPSIFELLAQSSLRQLLEPAFTYSLTLGANHFPRYLIPLAQRHEEVWAALLLLVERWSLLEHDASFSEQFYGLKRRRARRIETTRRDAFAASQGRGLESRLRSRLTKRQIWLSLVELVLLPYLGLKLRDAFLTRRAEAQLAAEIEPSSQDVTDGEVPQPLPNRRQRLRRSFSYLLVLLYPSLTTALAVVQLGWNVRYLFERTRFWTPAGLIGGWIVGRVDAADIRDPLPVRQTVLSPIKRRLPAFPIGLPALLPTLLLSLKLYEFYHALPSLAPSTPGALPPSSHPPLPPPPPPSALPPDSPTQWGLCVICGEPWKGPTVLAGSREGGGWVGCWSCFWDLGEEVEGDSPATLASETPIPAAKRSWWREHVNRDRMRRVLL